MKVDFKETVWYRIEVADEVKDEVLEKIKSGDIETSFNLLNDYNEYCMGEFLIDTSESLRLENNKNMTTIDVWDGNDNVFQNGKDVEDLAS